ncbi:MAG: type I DNA topoisomerase [Oscillospiraceae bacterium]|jgi:DNA topoisomerase-1|nr:type I DNA topoisomerase [Oscillospiraceae bacterium]
MKHALLIVESPAKARTIGNYLGSAYTVMATVGHIRDLPKSGEAVDIDNGFELKYSVIAGKEEVVAKLREQAEKADAVLLATDPDREGEAISWHLKELLGLKDEPVRVTFNEITKNEVRRSVENPRKIDMNLVDAQQARRALDRIVGFGISPVLWRRIRSGLSAGRVQSAATGILVEREEEIRAFTPQEYWVIEAVFAPPGEHGGFTAQYYGPRGGKKAALSSEAECRAVLAALEGARFTALSADKKKKKRSPSPPFITSSLQQEASRKLRMTPKRAMAVAQALYEGVQVEGRGPTGLITYMRTDSQRLSDESAAQAREYIQKTYGKDCLPAAARAYKTKKGAQDAHEAIRPTDAFLTPALAQASLTPEQYKLYKLIWSRFIACQMADAALTTLTIDVCGGGHVFRASHTSVEFAGFLSVYEESGDEEEEARGGALPPIAAGAPLALTGGPTSEQRFTKPPPRYTEASLIKALEEKGIGRPSTYAPTVSTILDREYAVKEKGLLRPTPLGETVTAYMRDKFPDIVDEEFTARMEGELDLVEAGKLPRAQMLGVFYKPFAERLAAADGDKTRVRVPDETTDRVCPDCGKGMVIKIGRFGRFLACTGYPDCKTTQPLSEETDGVCPLCGGTVLKKKSKKGFAYYGCANHPACAFMTWGAPMKDTCPDCGGTLFRPRYAKTGCCEKPDCPAFVPLEQRPGYKPKAEADGGDAKAEPPKGKGGKAQAAKAKGGKAKTAATKGKAKGGGAEPAT